MYSAADVTGMPHKLTGVNQPDNAAGGEAEGLPRLPPGRHGLPREFVVKNQHERLAAGIIQVVAERGYHKTTVADIADAAGVSRRTFYVYFKTKQECFLDTYKTIIDFLFDAMSEEGAAEKDWPQRVRAELRVLLEIFTDNPDLARFCLIAPPAAGGQVADTYRGFLERLLAALAEGRPESVRRPSDAAEHGLVGGLAALLVDRVEAGEDERLPELLPDLLELVLTPYIGRESAVRAARSSP